jgi:hypothetical protein
MPNSHPEPKRPRGWPRKPAPIINGAALPEPLLDEQQAAKILNVAPVTLRAARRTRTGPFGELRWVKFGSTRNAPARIEPSEIRRIIAKFRRPAPAEAEEL